MSNTPGSSANAAPLRAVCFAIPFVAAILVVSCAESPTAAPPSPVPIVIASTPAVQWSGGLASLRSEQFRQLSLIPLTDAAGSVIGNRWFNFVVLVGEDTADSWRADVDLIEYRVPALYSGTYSVKVRATGFLGATETLRVVGATKPVWGQLSQATATYQVQRIGNARVLMEDLHVYRILDLGDETLTPLFPDSAGRPFLQLPGPSYRPGHVVLGYPQADPDSLTVWSLDPPAVVTTLGCASGPDTAAELANGKCLSLDWRGIVAYQDSVLLEDYAFTGARFELSPNGEWGVLTTLHCCGFSARGLALSSGWPVFNVTQPIAYSVDEYDAVSGVAFSGNSDTLFVLAGNGEPPAESRSWKVEVLETATGSVIRSADLTAGLVPSAILLDPTQDRVFVAATVGGWGQTVLLVLDRNTLDVVMEVTAPLQFTADNEGGVLVFDGSSGRVHFVKTACCDVGGINVHTFDTM